MDRTEERFLVYTALLIVCSTIGSFLGLGVGIWTFIQIAAVIELMYWLGSHPGCDEDTRSLESR